MKQFGVFKISNMWSTSRLTRNVENELNKLTNEGYEIINVSFSFNICGFQQFLLRQAKKLNFNFVNLLCETKTIY